MQVSVEKTSELSRKMTVSVPEEVLQEKMAARLKLLAREVKMHGFRPGKVPQHIIKKIYGDRVLAEITEDLIKTTYHEALQEQNLKPIGDQNIQPLRGTEGFQYTAEFDVYPEIPLETVGQIEVSRPIAAVQEADVDGVIENMRLQKKHWRIVSHPSKEHDHVKISFSCVVEGENVSDGKVSNYSVVCGAKQMIPGFEENLIGLKVGDNKKFELPFPEKYGNEKLAGKVGEFEVDVISVEESVLPEIDGAFIKSWGIDGSVDDFREAIKSKLERDLERVLREKLRSAVLNALYEKFQIAVPNFLVNRDIEMMMKAYTETLKEQKQDVSNILREPFESRAKRRVALGLILNKVVHDNNMQADDAELRSTIEDMVKDRENPEDAVKWHYADENRLEDVRQMILDGRAVDWLITQVKISDVPISFSDAMNTQGQGI